MAQADQSLDDLIYIHRMNEYRKTIKQIEAFNIAKQSDKLLNGEAFRISLILRKENLLILKKENDRPNYQGNASAVQNLDLWRNSLNDAPLLLITPLNLERKKN